MKAVKRPAVVDAPLDDKVVSVEIVGMFAAWGNAKDEFLVVEELKVDVSFAEGFDKELFFNANPTMQESDLQLFSPVFLLFGGKFQRNRVKIDDFEIHATFGALGDFVQHDVGKFDGSCALRTFGSARNSFYGHNTLLFPKQLSRFFSLGEA